MRQRHQYNMDRDQQNRSRNVGHNYDYTAHYSGERFGNEEGSANQMYDRQNTGMQNRYSGPDYSQNYSSHSRNSGSGYGQSYGSTGQTYGNYASQGQGVGREWDQYSNQGYDRDRSFDSSRSSMGSDFAQNSGGRYAAYEGMELDRYGSEGRQSQGGMEKRRGRFFGKGPKGYQRSNERLQEEVNQCLWRAGEVDASEIEVSVENGTVTLSGTVSDRHMKRLAEREVESLEGVEDVRNNLTVKKADQAEGSELDLGSTTKKAMNERRSEDQVSEAQKGRSRNQMM